MDVNNAKLLKWKEKTLFTHPWILRNLGKKLRYFSYWSIPFLILLVLIILYSDGFDEFFGGVLGILSIIYLILTHSLLNQIHEIPYQGNINTLRDMYNNVKCSLSFRMLSFLTFFCYLEFFTESSFIPLNIALIFIFALFSDWKDLKMIDAIETLFRFLGIIPQQYSQNNRIDQALYRCKNAKKLKWIPVIGVYYFCLYYFELYRIGSVLAQFDKTKLVNTVESDLTQIKPSQITIQTFEEHPAELHHKYFFCTNCGGQVSHRGSRFCVYCGQKFVY